MSILDCIEVWVSSLRPLLESAGWLVHFDRSTDERSNSSCAVNLRRDNVEADLVAWESGEAELGIVKSDGSVNEEHVADLLAPGELVRVLAAVIGGISPFVVLDKSIRDLRGSGPPD